MSGIDNAKQAMDWMHPSERQSCGNCEQVTFYKHESARFPEYRCIKGGFFTTRYAICGEYVPAAPTGSAPT